MPYFGKFDPKSQHNLMVMFPFSVFDWKYPFWANLVQNVKIVHLSEKSVPRLTRICIIQWRCSLSCFRPEILFLGKFHPKSQSCQFKLKFGVQTNSSMKDSMMMFIFCCF